MSRKSRKYRRRYYKNHDFSSRDNYGFKEIGNIESKEDEVVTDKTATPDDNTVKTIRKPERTRNRTPKNNDYKLIRQFDEETGKVKYELEAVGVSVKEGKVKKAVTAAERRMRMEAAGKLHEEVSKEEDDNAAVEGAHKSEQAVEETVHTVKKVKDDRITKKRDRAAKLEKKQIKAETESRYKKYLEENPEARKKAFNKFLQKRRIKSEYAKALKKGEEAKEAAGYARKAVITTTAVARKLAEFTKKHIGAIATIALFGLFFMLIAAGVSSCSTMFNGAVSGVMGGSYQSVPAQLDASEDAMTSREMALQNTIDNVEIDHPGYDEYNYNIAEIGHNPFTLINYLSAVHVDVVAAAVDADISSLFDEMYTLELTPSDEIRTRTYTDPDTGTSYSEQYTVHILDVTLSRKELEDIVARRLSGNDDAGTLYTAYGETKGALQQFYTPLDLDWQSLISSYYGYRKNPVTGQNQFHRGVDIAVTEGTEVYAAQDGGVTTATYDSDYGNYVVISDDKGYETKYAHLSRMDVTQGQEVTHGTVIGATGSTGSSTGSHLHLECLCDGEYYNPLFYFENGDGSIYGTTDPLTYAPGDVAALFQEAERYLGFPYKWGGSSPLTSFDCSGFVCYVLTHSGFYNMPRTTAQGIYNQCTHISADQAQPGDLIFFTKTYNSGNPVTHVGIYAGNGQMIHCGDPIKYTSVNTPYWQSHFYGYGRLNTGGTL